jgi:hypothetical protein
MKTNKNQPLAAQLPQGYDGKSEDIIGTLKPSFSLS